MELSWLRSFVGAEWTEVMKTSSTFPLGIYSIVDKRSHKILTAGHITTCKEIESSYFFISFDNIHYFNFHGTEKYHCASGISDFDIQLKDIPVDYNIVPWMQRWTIEWTPGDKLPSDDLLIDPSAIDVYLEKELDPEVVKLVEALNKIPGIETVTSCSGHNKVPLEIDFYCHDFNSIKFLVELLPQYIVLHKGSNKIRNGAIAFRARVSAIGDEGYKQANSFAKIILEALP